MSKYLLLLITVFLFSVMVVSAQNPGRNAVFKKADLLDRTYSSALCSEDTGAPASVRLRNGKYETSDYYFRVMNKKVVYGDLTNDAVNEAIVPISCGSTAGNYSNADIYVFSQKGARPKLLANINSRDLERDYKRYFPKGFVVTVKQDSVRVVNGRILIDVYADGSNASPRYIASMTYRLNGSKPVITHKPTRRKAFTR